MIDFDDHSNFKFCSSFWIIYSLAPAFHGVFAARMINRASSSSLEILDLPPGPSAASRTESTSCGANPPNPSRGRPSLRFFSLIGLTPMTYRLAISGSNFARALNRPFISSPAASFTRSSKLDIFTDRKITVIPQGPKMALGMLN